MEEGFRWREYTSSDLTWSDWEDNDTSIGCFTYGQEPPVHIWDGKDGLKPFSMVSGCCQRPERKLQDLTWGRGLVEEAGSWEKSQEWKATREGSVTGRYPKGRECWLLSVPSECQFPRAPLPTIHASNGAIFWRKVSSATKQTTKPHVQPSY